MNWYDYQSEASQNVNLLNCKCEFVNSKPGIFDNIKQPSKLVQFLFHFPVYFCWCTNKTARSFTKGIKCVNLYNPRDIYISIRKIQIRCWILFGLTCKMTMTRSDFSTRMKSNCRNWNWNVVNFEFTRWQ